MKKKVAMLLTGVMAVSLMMTGCQSAKGLETENIKISVYKGVEVDKVDKPSEVTDDDVNTQIQSVLDENSTTEEVTGRAVKKGDTATIDFVGKMNGEAFDGGSSTDYPLEIGSNSFIDGFEDSIIGHNAGDTFDWNGKFPENYGSSDLAGKDVTFTITVKSISKKKTPKLTDKFVKKVSKESKTVKEYKKQVRDSLVSDKKSEAEQTNQETLWNKIMDNATQLKDFSKADIKKEVSNIKIENKEMAGYFGMSVSDFIEQYYEMSLEDYAKENLKKQCVQDLLLKEKSIEITDADVDEEIQYYIDELGYKDKKEVLSAISEDEIHSELQYTKLMDALMKETTIK